MCVATSTAIAIASTAATAGTAAYAAHKQGSSASQASRTQAAADAAAIQLQREQDAAKKLDDDRRFAEEQKRNDAEEANRAAEFAATEAQRQLDNARSEQQYALSQRQFEASQANQAAQLGLSREEFAAKQAQYDAEQARRAPYRAAGQTALTKLGDMLGISFPAGTATPSAARTTPPVAPASLTAASTGPATGGGSPTPEADAIAREQAKAGTAPTDNMAALPGFDLGKLSDPNHVNAKYNNSARELAYTLNAIQPSSDATGVKAAVDYLNTVRGVPAKMVGDDKIDMGDGNGPIDVLIDSGKGGWWFQNNPQPIGGVENTKLGALLPRVAPKPPVIPPPTATTGPVVTAPGPADATDTPYAQVIPMRTLLGRRYYRSAGQAGSL